MTTRFVSGSGTFSGSIIAPGDKSISHRALLFGAVSEGRSRITGLSHGEDVRSTVALVRSIGVTVEDDGGGVTLTSPGLRSLHEPHSVVDVGNSGTLIRLATGLLSGVPGLFVLSGDASVNGRPMSRVVEPLRSMGAKIDGRDGGAFAPLAVRGGDLDAISYRTPVPSAQVKSAILLAGLSARGSTRVVEATLTRPHTEEFLELTGVEHTKGQDAEGYFVEVGPVAWVSPFSVEVPSDPSQCAFFCVAALVGAASSVTFERVYDSPSRVGFLEVLQRMGGGVEISPVETGGPFPISRVTATSSALSPCEVGGADVASMVDEIPILAVAAAYADGVSTFSDLSELRIKESDRVATTASMLRAFGVTVEEGASHLVVHGDPSFSPLPARIDSRGDHRIAMCAAVMAAMSPVPSEILHADAVDTSYPSFWRDLASLQRL